MDDNIRLSLTFLKFRHTKLDMTSLSLRISLPHTISKGLRCEEIAAKVPVEKPACFPSVLRGSFIHNSGKNPENAKSTLREIRDMALLSTASPGSSLLVRHATNLLRDNTYKNNSLKKAYSVFCSL